MLCKRGVPSLTAQHMQVRKQACPRCTHFLSLSSSMPFHTEQNGIARQAKIVHTMIYLGGQPPSMISHRPKSRNDDRTDDGFRGSDSDSEPEEMCHLYI